MPYKAPPAIAPVAYTWTGCYIGINGGGAWGQKTWSTNVAFPDADVATSNSHDVTGGLVGGTIGCNYQTGQFVIGIEGDVDWADLSGSNSFTVNSPRFFTNLTERSKVDFLSTVTGRFGFAVDRALFYGKGGVAFAHDKFSIDAFGANFANADETRVGWTIGAGVEYAIVANWTAKIEYNYMDFGSHGTTFDNGDSADITQRIHAVKAGVNYRF